MLRSRGLCGLETKLFGLGLVVSGLGLVEIGLVASNMTLINIYNLVIDVHFCCVTIMKLSIICT